MIEHKTIRQYFLYLAPALTVFAILGGTIIYQEIQIYRLKNNVHVLALESASTTIALLQNTDSLSKNLNNLSKQTEGLSTTLTSAQENIDAVKNKVGGVEQTVGTISGTVGTLQKLASVDPQLLKKYSKVYFLNENYTPTHLTTIPAENLYSENRSEQFLTEAWPHLNQLFIDAKASGVNLYVKSAYRSFAEQKSLKSSYSTMYGAGTANAFSADQGYSEHQLGTTVDFITTGLGGQLNGFNNTEAYKWLQNNAYRYGFELSYPKGNKYYIYEPWHWRYVGVALATYLHNNNLNFYDLDQREIDKYLVNIFD